MYPQPRFDLMTSWAGVGNLTPESPCYMFLVRIINSFKFCSRYFNSDPVLCLELGLHKQVVKVPADDRADARVPHEVDADPLVRVDDGAVHAVPEVIGVVAPRNAVFLFTEILVNLQGLSAKSRPLLNVIQWFKKHNI